jgi:hypothetical protein
MRTLRDAVVFAALALVASAPSACVSDGSLIAGPTRDAAADVIVPKTCATDEQMCGLRCVKLDDPSYGCGASNCAPCNSGGFVSLFKCVQGRCEIDSCAKGRGDCNGLASDGCETSLTVSENCGGCGIKCSATSQGFCVGGSDAAAPMCASSCPAESPKVCSGSSCANLNSDIANCGICGTACQAPSGGKTLCVNGTCENTCPTGTTIDPTGNDCRAVANTCKVEGKGCMESVECCSGACAQGACIAPACGMKAALCDDMTPCCAPYACVAKRCSAVVGPPVGTSSVGRLRLRPAPLQP